MLIIASIMLLKMGRSHDIAILAKQNNRECPFSDGQTSIKIERIG